MVKKLNYFINMNNNIIFFKFFLKKIISYNFLNKNKIICKMGTHSLYTQC